MTTDLYPRDNCIAPDISSHVHVHVLAVYLTQQQEQQQQTTTTPTEIWSAISAGFVKNSESPVSYCRAVIMVITLFALQIRTSFGRLAADRRRQRSFAN